MSIIKYSQEHLDRLASQAKNSPRFRQHYNIHKSYQDNCQILLNAIQPDSYIRPHCHGLDQGAETLFALQGLMVLICFNDSGKVLNTSRFGAGYSSAEPDVLLGVEIPPGIWHTVVALESDSVLLEIKGGPFDPLASKFPAVWAPEEGSSGSAAYFDALKEVVANLI